METLLYAGAILVLVIALYISNMRDLRKSSEKPLNIGVLFIPLTGSKTPPQNSAEAKKLGGDQLSVKSD